MIKKTLIIFSLLFLVAVWQAHWLYNMSIYIPSYITGLSFFTFIMYAWDKRQAKQSAHKKVNRTPERRLQLLSLLGGWPGALIAQQWLRHKSQKRRFIVVLWLCIILNVASILSVFFLVG
ncbi:MULTISPECIES: DUF1294 domain-containing protein [unclassified Pseudoalteromonas]|uniref:DUF1294 domain-containing protein n=1 Tax=unclassified Pseudoalteromonas TaxID=194690 RepID=UPI0004A37554|nr:MULTISPECIES: DUF1294 domain-containing protein [unclassified Pseudoalteromonas]MDC9496702.1 DUF1294 domain-containing protein [Pseudoalteromonas sp. Angola-20]MDC9516494.1 DUF1294 domain-containing protein [Pseudoalteromonas sp. Angola-22]MDC9533009.1 DUF1294 domain-containing protein [Pseudoalteromonas sp. Angola-9]TMP84415.1 rhomboid protease GlpG [Pseudoalteromonas sp. S983]